jgi:hypothetical protein
MFRKDLERLTGSTQEDLTSEIGSEPFKEELSVSLSFSVSLSLSLSLFRIYFLSHWLCSQAGLSQCNSKDGYQKLLAELMLTIGFLNNQVPL